MRRMSAVDRVRCPGCGVELPRSGRSYDFKFHASAECWSQFEEVLAREYQNPVLLGQVHRLTVDAYAVQHAGGAHPDKSVCVHLVGLYLTHEKVVAPSAIVPLMQRLTRRGEWPHLVPPADPGTMTVRDVALAESPQRHAVCVREWAAIVWRAWSPHHGVARALVEELAGSTRR